MGGTASGLVNLDIDLLRTFATIADMRSFTRAAERLFRTQSTISLQVKRLEETLGYQLFERSARTVRLTPDGEMLLSYARRILAINDEVVARVTEPDIAGLVRLGAPEDFATAHLPKVLGWFARTHPRVALQVTCDLTLNLLDRFAAGEFDIVLVKREPQGGSDGVRVWREPLVWVAAAGSPDWRRDDGLPLVVSPHPCVYRKRATEALDGVGQRWRIAYTCSSLSGAQAAVRAGLGVTVLPKDMVPAEFVTLAEGDGLPDLHDTEIALMTQAAQLPKPAELLAAHIVRSLGHVGIAHAEGWAEGTDAGIAQVA